MTEWTPDAQERFFSKLYEEVAEPDDQPEDVAQKVASAVGGISRREMLAGAGILGGGALLGGGGTAALTGDAQAAASTTDGDGDIGTPSNPEDVFADALSVYDGANNRIGGFDETGIDTPSVDTDEASVGGQPDINYWPPVRIDPSREVNDSSPPTSYTSADLSAAIPSDATHVLLRVVGQGDGTSNAMSIDVREGGTTRTRDIRHKDWAGHGEFTIGEAPSETPVNSNGEVEYKADSCANVQLWVQGYY